MNIGRERIEALFHSPPDQGRIWALYRVIMLGIAGGIMLIASLMPWLLYPTGEHFLAWQLPVNLGWQLRSPLFNYGLLCLACTCSIFFIVFIAWQTLLRTKRIAEVFDGRRRAAYPSVKYAGTAALLCLLPPLLFLFQYLFIDMQSTAALTRSELQLLLIKTHLGYSVADQFAPIQSLAFHPLDFTERLGLLLDHTSIGLFLPFVSSTILLSECILRHKSEVSIEDMKKESHILRSPLVVLLSFLTIIMLGRSPAALLCTYQAEHSLSTGDYHAVLQWLNTAHLLNPSLDQLAVYHIERGQAEYFLHPEQSSVESRAYLAAYYRQQNDLLSSYQELMEARQQYPHTQWLTDEISLSIERLAELSTPLKGQRIDLLNNDTPALSWLYQLEQIDPTNVYVHYTIGRILYDVHDYSDCESEMRSVLALNSLNDVQSSAYTYMALSKIGLGEPVIAREYLFKAESLDPEYHNNTARQNISGLR
jgi:hypothetical protein